jgi:hypothetical protein
VEGLKRAVFGWWMQKSMHKLGGMANGRALQLLGDGNGLIEAYSKAVVEEQLRGLLSWGVEDGDGTA